MKTEKKAKAARENGKKHLKKSALPMIAYILMALSLLTISACNKLPNTNSTGPSPDHVFKDSGIVQGTTISDWDKVQNVSFTVNTKFQVQVNGVMLNNYEYSILNGSYLQFGHQVTVLGSGSLTYQTPFVPVAPAGSTYTIQFTN